MRIIFIVGFMLLSLTNGLDNGLALTPPMGWLSWERFRCNIDCRNDPNNCIGENLFKTMANIVAKEGYKDVGYEFINIDDCWLARDRAADGSLKPDPDRFPSGIKALSDYIHNLGLKFGIYADFGTHTCEGFPGTEFYMQMDAETFASWGVDYLKLDACYADPGIYDEDYPPMAYFLNRTGRPMVLSCAYPLYQGGARTTKPNYVKVARACNLAYNFDNVADSWDSVASIVNAYGDNLNDFATQARPGYFNDPDELIIGDFGLSYDQQRVQMGMWAIMASPLMMSVDLRNIRTESKALLLNKYVLAINQDPLGVQGRQLIKKDNIQIWSKPVMPKGSLSFAILNMGTDGIPIKVSVKLSSLSLNSQNGYSIQEVFDNKPFGLFKPSDNITAHVNPTGIFLAKAIPL